MGLRVPQRTPGHQQPYSVKGGGFQTISGANTNGVASGNTAIIENTNVSAYIIGGRSTTVENGRIVMTNSYANRVYGGETYIENSSTSARYNTVELRGTTSIGDIVYGGVLTSNLQPILDSYQYDLVTGNKLIVAPTT